MTRWSAQAILMLFALLPVSAAGCWNFGSEKPGASAPAQPDQALQRDQTAQRNPAAQHDPAVQTNVAVEDGVYPVVVADETGAQGNPEIEVVELPSVPVEGSEDETPETIRVIPKPLLRFTALSHFDFKFVKNECTEIGFQNTDELRAYTRDHVGARLAVVVDNRVISHHKIREAIETGEVRITCCTVGGGDHLHKYLQHLKLTSNASSR